MPADEPLPADGSAPTGGPMPAGEPMPAGGPMPTGGPIPAGEPIPAGGPMTAGGLPRVDPMAPANLPTRWLRRAFDIEPIGRFLIGVAAGLDPILHSWTRGRLGRLVPMPFASMTTTGARSGRPRTAAVIYFNDGDDVILIASNYGGIRHPAWYHNLRDHPQAHLERGRRGGDYIATEVTDEQERERLFALAHHVYAGFAHYRVRTAQFGRRIPIMRLRPAS